MSALKTDICEKDKSVLRRLAEQKAAIAHIPIHIDTANLWSSLNLLNQQRPMVWVNEIPWYEFGIENSLQTIHPFSRNLERNLRMELYQWEHLPADMLIKDVIYCPLVVHDSGFGIMQKSEKISSESGNLSEAKEGERKPQVLSTEPVHSRHFEPQILQESDIENIQFPHVDLDDAQTEENFQTMQNIFRDVIKVEKRGFPGFWFAPWDDLITWWGVQEALIDLIQRPDMVKAAMERLVNAHLHRLSQYEKLGLLSRNNDNTRIGSGGYGYIPDLNRNERQAEKVETKDLWGCATAQIFCNVSPSMHKEFAIDYEIKWLRRFGLNYYGCCEPLHHKIPILREIPNLRKISISPWADIEEAVSQIGQDYVISYKPNPAIFAEEKWDITQCREELIGVLEKMKGCHVEVIMKDISTVRGEPRRLWEWAQMAKEVAEHYCT